MKKHLIYIIIALIVALTVSVWSCTAIRSDRERLSDNQSVLMDTMQTYRVRDSLSAASVGILTLERDELRQHRAADVQMIRDLGVRLSRVQAVVTTATEGRYEVKASLTPSTGQPFDRSPLNDSIFQVASDRALATALDKTAVQRFALHTPYIDINGTVVSDSLSASIAVRDTLVQVLHRVPRFKFLGIWFGTKAVRQEIISKNPHTRIVAAEYIELKRR